MQNLLSAEEYSLPASKMIATGQKSKILHKEELNMSETERRIKRNVEENARLQQKKRTVQQQLQQQSHSQSAKTTPQRRENKVTLSLLFSQLFILSSFSLPPSLSLTLSLSLSLSMIGLSSLTFTNTQVIHQDLAH